jgi:hypothetical protein
MEFSDRTTATFTMVSTSKDVCIRKTRIFGSLGQLEIDGDRIDHFDFLTMSQRVIPLIEDKEMPPKQGTRLAGHGGADWHLMNSFISAVASGDASKILTGPDDTLASHMLVFNAEKARLSNSVVEVKE